MTVEEKIRYGMFAYAKTLLRLAVREHGGANRGEVVSKLLDLQGGDDGDPWCAAFWSGGYELSHDLAGVPRPFNPGLSTRGIVDLGRKYNKIVTNPACGDAVCFKVADGENDKYGTGFKHTAMFGAWLNEAKTRYYTIEGNVGDAVAIREHTIHESVVYVSCI